MKAEFFKGDNNFFSQQKLALLSLLQKAGVFASILQVSRFSDLCISINQQTIKITIT